MRLHTIDGPEDYCRRCWPAAKAADPEGAQEPHDHPDYTEWNDYTCEDCGRKLTNADQ